MGSPELPRAEVAALLYVEIFRQRWQANNFPSKLLVILENDLCPVIVLFHFASNFDHLAGRLSYVTDIFQIMRKHDDRKTAQPVVVAEIEIVAAARSRLNSNHFSSHALPFAEMFFRLIKTNGCRARTNGGEEEKDKNLRDALHAPDSNLKLKVAAQKVGENVRLFPKGECGDGRASTPVPSLRNLFLPECLHRCGLVVFYVEDRVQLGDL